MKQHYIAILFLNLFGAMIIVSTVERLHIDTAPNEITLSLDWDFESESEDSEKEIEDVDKIIPRFYDALSIYAHSIMHKKALQRARIIHEEIHLPPPELS